jgi:hypothetical protein
MYQKLLYPQKKPLKNISVYLKTISRGGNGRRLKEVPGRETRARFTLFIGTGA